MKQPAIDTLVYDTLFPRPKPSDPRNFQCLLAQHLVPEVRFETQAFYGSLSTQEAKYPGLDYSYKPHRMRLARYPWHRRLFRAFDSLGLTKTEIAGLTRWEGTRWARERFEREEGVRVRDTTGEEIREWVEPESRRDMRRRRHATSPGGTATRLPQGEILPAEFRMVNTITSSHMSDDVLDSSDDDDEISSVGLELNERLRAAVAQREAGHANIIMDPEWEQWLKDAAEAGAISFPSNASNSNGAGHLLRSSLPSGLLGSSTGANDHAGLQPRLVQAAREGRWDTIPQVFHEAIHRHIANENHIRDMRSNSGRALRREERRALSLSQVASSTNISRQGMPGSLPSNELRATAGSIASRARHLESRIERFANEASLEMHLNREMNQDYRRSTMMGYHGGPI